MSISLATKYARSQFPLNISPYESKIVRNENAKLMHIEYFCDAGSDTEIIIFWLNNLGFKGLPLT